MKQEHRVGIPLEAGYYKRVSQSSNRFQACAFADSKQIDEDYYVLQHDLFYRCKDGRIIVIKKGFIHDGASKGFLRHFGKYTNPAISHDGLYGIQHDREDSDELFDESMEVCGVGWLRRNTYWLMVRMFGESAFNDQTKEDVEKNKKFVEIIGG